MSKTKHPPQSITINHRQAYLRQMGLKRDPFVTPVAEQEAALSHFELKKPNKELGEALQPDEPGRTFFSYYTSPAVAVQGEQTFLQVLRQPRPAFIYGPPGSGKTTQRLTLEADCRSVPDGTLVVSYLLTEDLTEPLKAEQHWSRLAQAFSIDLFIQIVEQINPLHTPPTEKQVGALQEQLRLGGSHLKRLARRVLDEPTPESLYGLGAFWPALGRPAVPFVGRSPQLMELIQACMPSRSRQPRGEEDLLSSLNVARQWGFHQVFVLVDGVDTRQRQQDFMLDFLRPLLEHLEHWSKKEMFFKFFLPEELRPSISACIRQYPMDLRFLPFESTITWDETALHNLLAERFRAAGSRQSGFDSVAGIELEDQLDRLIIWAANGSPRQLLKTASRLVDTHVMRDAKAQDPFITAEDWEDLRATWRCASTLPPAPSKTLSTPFLPAHT